MTNVIVYVILSTGSLADDWEAGPPAYHVAISRLAPKVMIEDDTVILRNRGILFSRRATSTVDLSFDWTWIEGIEEGNYHDHLCIAIGTDGKQRRWACEVDHGIVIRFNPGIGAVQIENMEHGSNPVIVTKKTGFTFTRGMTYAVRLVQKDRSIKVAVNDDVAITASLPVVVHGKVAIYNRESVAGIAKESRLSRLRLASDVSEKTIGIRPDSIASDERDDTAVHGDEATAEPVNPRTEAGGLVSLAVLRSQEMLNCVAISRDGGMILTGGGSIGKAGEVTVWDAASGRKLRSVTEDSTVVSVDVSLDGSTLAVATMTAATPQVPQNRSTIRIIDRATGQEHRAITWGGAMFPRVAFSPDGQRLLAGAWVNLPGITGGGVKVWSTDTWQEEAALDGVEFNLWRGRNAYRQRPKQSLVGKIAAIAWAPDGSWFVTGGGQRLQLFRISDWAEVPLLARPPEPVHRLAVSPDGRFLATVTTGSSDVQIWQLSEAQVVPAVLHTDVTVRCITFATDPNIFVTGHDDGTLRIWDIAAASEQSVTKAHDAGVSAMAVARGSRLLVTAGDDRIAKVWPLALGRPLRTARNDTSNVSSYITDSNSMSGKDDVSRLILRADQFHRSGNITTARGLYEDALTLARRGGEDSPLVRQALRGLGLVCYLAADYGAAELYLMDYYDRLKKRSPHAMEDIRSAAISLAYVYADTGEFVRAAKYFGEASRLATQDRVNSANDRVALQAMQALTLHYQAQAYQAAGDLERGGALAAYADSLFRAQHAEKAGAAPTVPHMDPTLRTIEAFKAKLNELRRQRPGPGEIVALSHEAQAYANAGRYAEAEPLARRAIEASASIDPSRVGTALQFLVLAEIEAGLGHVSEAEQLYQLGLPGLEAKFGPRHPTLLFAKLQHASSLAAHKTWKDVLEETNLTMRQLHEYMVNTLPGMPYQQQLAFLQAKCDPAIHRLLSTSLSGPSNSPLIYAAVEWVLNFKGISRDIMVREAASSLSAAGVELRSLAAELRENRSRLSERYIEGDEDSNLAPLLERERMLSVRLGATLRQGVESDDWVTLQSVQSALPPRSVLVEILRCSFFERDLDVKGRWRWVPARYVAWVIPSGKGGTVHEVNLGPASVIEAAIREYRDSLNRHDGGHVDTDRDEAARKLSHLLLDPLLQHIDGAATRIYLSPDGATALVPWPALRMPNGRFAIEQFTMSYLSSGRALLGARGGTSHGGVVVFADPNFDAVDTDMARRPRGPTTDGSLHSWSPVQGWAAQQASILKALTAYVGSAPAVYTDTSATEESFYRLQGPQVLLLNTHGFHQSSAQRRASQISRQSMSELPSQTYESLPTNLRPDLAHPLARSGIVLAGANRRRQGPFGDGIVTALEMLSIDFRGTELAVLGACETGLGSIEPGEGILGLGHAMHIAGAQTVVTSLWRVPDRTTAEMLSAFFNHLSGGETKAGALRSAQLHMLRHGAGSSDHPFYWAAWIVSGDADSYRATVPSVVADVESTKGDTSESEVTGHATPQAEYWQYAVVTALIGVLIVWRVRKHRRQP